MDISHSLFVFVELIQCQGFFFFFFFAISKITLHDLLDANTVDLWLC